VRAEVEQNWTAVGSYGKRSTPNLIREALCVKISFKCSSAFTGTLSSLIGSHFDLVATEVHAAPPA